MVDNEHCAGPQNTNVWQFRCLAIGGADPVQQPLDPDEVTVGILPRQRTQKGSVATAQIDMERAAPVEQRGHNRTGDARLRDQFDHVRAFRHSPPRIKSRPSKSEWSKQPPYLWLRSRNSIEIASATAARRQPCCWP